MNAFQLFTWIAIAVLLVGSVTVFAWFFVDFALQRAARPKRRRSNKLS